LAYGVIPIGDIVVGKVRTVGGDVGALNEESYNVDGIFKDVSARNKYHNDKFL
jgi:hypothetical protein